MDLNSLNQQENTKAKVVIAGQEVEVEKNAKVADTLRDLLAARGIDSFTIIVDGDEVDSTSDLPETFGDSDIEVERYAKPGK